MEGYVQQKRDYTQNNSLTIIIQTPRETTDLCATFHVYIKKIHPPPSDKSGGSKYPTLNWHFLNLGIMTFIHKLTRQTHY